MEALRRFIQAFMAMNVGMTAVELAGERGGRFLLTFVALVLALTAAPYVASLWGMRRLSARWAQSVAVAAALYGAADSVLRMQALYFPVQSGDPARAVWIPLASIVVIPVLSALAYPLVRLAVPERVNGVPPSSAGTP
jgi:hypothetical protein